MKQYSVTGMSCAACSTRVEKAVTKVPGVTSCSVSLLTNSMGVEGTATQADIVKAVEEAISAIGVVSFSSEEKIQKAEEQFSLLSEKEQAKVEK